MKLFRCGQFGRNVRILLPCGRAGMRIVCRIVIMWCCVFVCVDMMSCQLNISIAKACEKHTLMSGLCTAASVRLQFARSSRQTRVHARDRFDLRWQVNNVIAVSNFEDAIYNMLDNHNNTRTHRIIRVCYTPISRILSQSARRLIEATAASQPQRSRRAIVSS